MSRGGVYCLTFADGSWYVGQTNNLTARKLRYKSNLKLGKANKLLLNAFTNSNNVQPTFDIIEYVDTLEERVQIEQIYLNTRLQTEARTCLNEERPVVDGLYEIKYVDRKSEIITEISSLANRINELTGELDELNKSD